LASQQQDRRPPAHLPLPSQGGRLRAAGIVIAVRAAISELNFLFGAAEFLRTLIYSISGFEEYAHVRACAHVSFSNFFGAGFRASLQKPFRIFNRWDDFSVVPAMCRSQNYYGFYYLDEMRKNSVLAGFDRWPADARFYIEVALRQPAQLSSSSIEGAETTSVEIYSPTHSLSLFVAATIRHTVASNPDI
jgi:hypothetical protein